MTENPKYMDEEMPDEVPADFVPSYQLTGEGNKAPRVCTCDDGNRSASLCPRHGEDNAPRKSQLDVEREAHAHTRATLNDLLDTVEKERFELLEALHRVAVKLIQGDEHGARSEAVDAIAKVEGDAR